ncbi:MAG: EF-P beta-lysylation protein EpmB [Gammaproteobacteria bacterium]|jgi:L-lysine 2,3-aminomutase
MATGFADAGELLEWLGTAASDIPGGVDPDSEFPFKVPLSFAGRIRRGDPNDPLLLQVLPTGSERQHAEGFVADPVGDLGAVNTRGVLHKYHGRVLLIVTGACGIHCRYCFRRHFPYREQRLERVLSDDTLAQLDSKEIQEIILSGGDPLTLSDGRFAELLEQLQGLEHLRRLRIHTRMPTVLPERVTPELAASLAGFRLPVTLVLHVNHPNEYSPETDAACRLLRRAGVQLLNQAVLLKGVNDDVATLEALCTRGFDAGVLPYYIHQLDRVAGSAHFYTPPAAARWLEERLRDRLPGYLMPRFVIEIAGKASKIPVAVRVQAG